MCTSVIDMNTKTQRLSRALTASIACAFALSGCVVGPKYVRPAADTPTAYKELSPESTQAAGDWKVAQPRDAATRGKWWLVFDDPQLNELEQKADASNQNIAAAADSFLAARALVRQARAQYWPTVAANPSIVNSRPSPGQLGSFQSSSTAGIAIKSFTDYSLPFDASWEPDFWGRIRNTVRASVFAAQASAAEVQNVRLSEQAELAVDYYQLRAQDSLKQILDSTVISYQATLELTQAQYRAGLSSDEAVAQAEAQLKAAQAQDTNLGILRAQYEHAIAVLIGQPASTFTSPMQNLQAKFPVSPLGIPAELLERRPDVAAAERNMAQANAQIGIAVAAYYPNITLSATGGLGNRLPFRLVYLAEPLLVRRTEPGGDNFRCGIAPSNGPAVPSQLRSDRRELSRDGSDAFQQVEDNLATLRFLSQSIEQQDAAVDAASRSLREATVRYTTGIDPYLNVLVAQTILLTDQQTAVNYRMQQMVASVQLIKALGGGWDAAQIPLTAADSRPSAAKSNCGAVIRISKLLELDFFVTGRGLILSI